jgi:hypothetical protein
MSVLGSAVLSGAANHPYDGQRNVDEFVCTQKSAFMKVVGPDSKAPD